MDIIQNNKEQKGNFIAIENGVQVGIITYIWEDANKIIVEHTVVEPQFEGKGVGKQLVMAVVKFARENKIKIVPLCSYTKRVFDKDPEAFKDVVA